MDTRALLVSSFFLVLFLAVIDNANGQAKFATGPLKHAHATHYEGNATTFGGACGYSDVVKQGYGLQTVALSNALFNKGEMCGACFELKCENNPQWCKPGNPSLIVTATNHCPPNPAQDPNNGGWCNDPREHFDIARPVFETLAGYKAGIIPVNYRRIPCSGRKGGIKFTFSGNPWYTEVLVWNVGGVGSIKDVKVKTAEAPAKWLQMARTFGQKWNYNGQMTKTQAALGFQLTASDGKSLILESVAPKGWSLGQTYEAKSNFT